MTLTEICVIATIILLIITALIHSIAGERLLLQPLLKARGNRVLEHDLARMLLRYVWHLTSLVWLLIAMLLCFMTFTPERALSLSLLSTAAVFIPVGLFDLIASRGRHVGWPFLMLIGVVPLIGWSAL